MLRIGYQNILGYLEAGIEAIKLKGHENIDSVPNVDYDKAKKMIEENKLDLVDVREQTEYETTSVIDYSHLYPLSGLERKIEEIKKLQKPFGVFCSYGGRATIASSIFWKNNITSIYLLGGFRGLAEKGVKVLKFAKK